MRAAALALLVVLVLAAAGRWGSFVAGGSDSYCYVHQAERWASGRLQLVEPLALDAPWPNAPRSFAPAGHVPSPTVPGALVPICPAGLSMLMALATLVGGPGAVFVVVPAFGAVLLLATAAFGARFSPRVGLASTILLACSPAFLYQLFQPMSDVPAAACWMLAIVFGTSTAKRAGILAGMAGAVAILIRPNLVPLGVVLGLFMLLRPERAWPLRWRTAAVYAVWCGAGCTVVALIQREFYGSAFSSGYGSFNELFSIDHVGPNLGRYARWIWETQTPFVALACLAPFLLPGPLTTFAGAWLAVNAAIYLPYIVFDDWSSLRFFLPTAPLLLVLATACVDSIARRLGARVWQSATVTAVLVLLVSWTSVGEAAHRQTFRLRDLESRFARVGSYVGSRLPANAIVFASVHSGSVRYYGRRLSVVWDELDPAWLDEAVTTLRERGFDPYFVLEAGEEAPFRERFGQDPSSVLAALDWPPLAEVGSQVRIYAPGDRERYQKGAAKPTEYAP
jgi:hypothetical protein